MEQHWLEYLVPNPRPGCPGGGKRALWKSACKAGGTPPL